ncbi:MAG: propanediol utilization protein, partial [Cytophagaceae bacterium]
INIDAIKQALQGATDRLSGQQGIQIQVPNAKGEIERFLVWENSNFETGFQAEFPNIRAYVGKGITDPTAVLNFSVSHKGIQTMILRADTGSEFIEPYTKDNSIYIAFDSKTRRKGSLPLVCTTDDVQLSTDLGRGALAARASNGVLKTMRLALSCNGEYTQFHGGQVADAVAAMNATMARVNGVFEKDLALHLNIINGNTAVIFTTPATDPYSTNLDQWNQQLQTTLTTIIQEANYDIGHMFGASGGGGNAGCIGCVCVSPTANVPLGKGSGITSPADGIPEGDTFDIDYVAHEMGHQLGGNHTFSHSGENNSVNVEPGSGSTIMAYAGITGATDVQPNSDDYFTYRSILQIQSNLVSKTCPVSTPVTPNVTPVVSAGPNFTIPKGTAFKLTGTGSDGNGDSLTYTWEQNDDATAVGAASSYPSGTKTQGPNFRSFDPVATPVRYFPAFQTVLGGGLSSTWEATSTVARTLNFTLTARDNFPGAGQTQTDDAVITVNGTAGPFAVTAPASGASWLQGTTQNVTWNVAGTTANGVNTANVNILLSTDNGATFQTLLANTPNDGSEAITVPNLTGINCRIIVEAVGNVFYALSQNFSVGYTIATTCATYSNNSILTIPDGPNGTIVSNTITVPAMAGTISDVNVGLNVLHTWPNDLVFRLRHPDNTEVLVWNRACAGNDNFNVTLSDGGPAFTCATNMTGTFSPSSPLAAFNGKAAAGTWAIGVNDNAAQDTGSMQSWSIEVCT